MADDFLRVSFSEEDGRRKLKFRQKDLRDVVVAARRELGPTTSLADLLGDMFAGWPYLVQYGLRSYDPGITLDKASELMEAWVRETDPETHQLRTSEDLGKILIAALNATGFVKVELGRKDAEPDKGNARPEAAIG